MARLPKHPRSGQRLGKKYAGRDVGDGMVAKRSGRWWSFDWWYGHWGERNRCGEYRADGSPENVCTRGRGHSGPHKFGKAPAALLRGRRPVGPKQAGRARTMGYAEYLEARMDQADAATRGVMVSPAGRAAGINPRIWFKGAGATSSRYMSEELTDWFRDHGPNLSATRYRELSRE